MEVFYICGIQYGCRQSHVAAAHLNSAYMTEGSKIMINLDAKGHMYQHSSSIPFDDRNARFYSVHTQECHCCIVEDELAEVDSIKQFSKVGGTNLHFH